ncbi:MAG: dihydroorotase [Candidatus Krumholzibacteria bacterium]|nr:dihydroorotase [Candidatus Krumholzibacteria bacterium]
MKNWLEVSSMDRWWVDNVKVVDPVADRVFDGSLCVQDGLIAELREGPAPEDAPRLDGEGLHLAPGLVDLHVHLREPGFEEKETIESGSRSAARGGVTTLCAMPNTNPVCDDGPRVSYILERSAQAGFAKVLPVGAITRGSEGRELADLGEMHYEGACAFSDDGRPVSDSGVMRRAMELGRTWDALIMSHSEERSLSEGGQVHEGAMSAKLGLEGIPREAESIAVDREVRLSRLTGARLHLCHLSSGSSVEILRRAKADGLKVTGETTPHYLLLDDSAIEGYDTHKKMNPPIREKSDQEALVAGLCDGTLDAVATDHAPHTEIEKNVEFAYAPFGVIGLETSLAAVLTRLYHSKLMELPRVLALMSSRPGAILGGNAGSLEPGSPADLCLFDPEEEWLVRAEDMASRSRNTAFEGMTLRGRVRATFLNGSPVYRRTMDEGKENEVFTPAKRMQESAS